MLSSYNVWGLCMSASQPRFFQVSSHKKLKQCDAVFVAVAVAIVDKIRHSPRDTAANALWQHVSARYVEYFPQYNHDVSRSHTYSAQRAFRGLENIEKLHALVAEIAYTLRQIVVDEMITNCDNSRGYTGAFLNSNNPDKLREGDTKIKDNLVFRALTQTLPLKVVISNYGDRSDNVPCRNEYGGHAGNVIAIELRVYNSSYEPKLFDTSIAVNYKILSTTAGKPTSKLSYAGTVERCEHFVENKRKRFLSVTNRLFAMLRAQDTTLESIESLYINNLAPSSDYKHCFRDMVREHRQEEQEFGSFTVLIVHAIASEIANGRMELDVLDDLIEPDGHRVRASN